MLSVLSLYGNQLQLHLLHKVQQQMQQGDLQQQQQSVPGVPGQRATTGDGSSTSSCTPADEAEGVLLCRADMLQSEQLHHLPDNPAAVQSWQQHFAKTLPHHLLLTTASAIATAADTSTRGQGYSYVQPPHCLVDAARCTAAVPDAAGSSSSSGNKALVDVSTCVAVVATAARLLRIRVWQDDRQDDPAQVCQHHPGLVTTPLLLLSSVVATLRLAPAEQALRAAAACAKSAALLADPHHRVLKARRDVVDSPVSGSSRQPGAGTAGDALAHTWAGLAWPATGWATLLARQVICVVDAAAAVVAADAGSGGSSDGQAAANTPPTAAGGAAGSATMLPLQLSALIEAAMGMDATLSVGSGAGEWLAPAAQHHLGTEAPAAAGVIHGAGHRGSSTLPRALAGLAAG